VREGRSTHDEVYPEAPGVRGVKVGASGEPFRTESHPPTQSSALQAFSRYKKERSSPSVKFGGRQNDDPVVPRRVVLDELTDDVAT